MSGPIDRLPQAWRRGRLERAAAWSLVYALRSMLLAVVIGVLAAMAALVRSRGLTVVVGGVAAAVFVAGMVLLAAAIALLYAGLLVHRDNVADLRRVAPWVAVLSLVPIRRQADGARSAR